MLYAAAVKVKIQVTKRPATMPQLPQAADGLQPAEALLHELPFLLTDGVAGMPGRAAIDRAAPMDALVYCATCGVTDMARRFFDEIARVIGLTAATVMRWRPGRRSIITSAASRSPWPSAGVTFAFDVSPDRCSISTWPR